MRHSNLLTTADVAAELGVSQRRVLALIASERLPAKQFGPIWMIERRDLRNVRVRRSGGAGQKLVARWRERRDKK